MGDLTEAVRGKPWNMSGHDNVRGADGAQVELGTEGTEGYTGSGRPGLAGPPESGSSAMVLAIGAGSGTVVRRAEVRVRVAAFGAEQLLELVQQILQKVPGDHRPAVAHRNPRLPETKAGIPPDHHARIPGPELAQAP
jgi:hypothetical protein